MKLKPFTYRYIQYIYMYTYVSLWHIKDRKKYIGLHHSNMCGIWHDLKSNASLIKQFYVFILTWYKSCFFDVTYRDYNRKKIHLNYSVWHYLAHSRFLHNQWCVSKSPCCFPRPRVARTVYCTALWVLPSAIAFCVCVLSVSRVCFHVGNR